MKKYIFDFVKTVLIEECNNLFIRSFYTIQEYWDEHNIEPENVHIAFIEPGGSGTAEDLNIHPGHLSLPTAPEIAVLLHPNPPVGSSRVVVYSMRQSGPTENLSFFGTCHGSYSPLAYHIFQPYGTTGWHFGMSIQDNAVLPITTCLRYYLMT